MIRLQRHRVGKAESLFVANLKPFFDSIGPSATSRVDPGISASGGEAVVSQTSAEVQV
jgi:hypothetical protein